MGNDILISNTISTISYKMDAIAYLIYLLIVSEKKNIML